MSQPQAHGKDIKRFIKRAKGFGFTVEYNKHIKLKLGSSMLVLASSPSCPYAILQAEQEMRRILAKEKP